MRIVLLLLLAACGSKASVDNGSCSEAVANAQAVSEKAMPTGLDPKMADRMHAMMEAATKVMTEACTNDKWAPDVLTCLKSATTSQDLTNCQKMLTPEQSAAVTKAIKQAASGVKAPGQIDPALALMKAKELKDKMCACADATCAKAVEQESIKNIRASEHARHDDATKAEFNKLDDDMMACFRKLTK